MKTIAAGLSAEPRLVTGGAASDTIGAYIGAIIRAPAPAGIDTVAWRRSARAGGLRCS